MEPIKELFAARPQLADEMSQVLAQREVRLAAAREGLSEEAARGRLAAEGSSLSGRIRSFFGLG
jgi:CRP-like cAMP-binding protein